VVGECEKGAAGFDHDHFSKEKIACSRYDIDTNSLLLAEWLVSDFPRAAASKFQELGGPHEPLNEVR
jgi:hypothetical protein